MTNLKVAQQHAEAQLKAAQQTLAIETQPATAVSVPSVKPDTTTEAVEQPATSPMATTTPDNQTKPAPVTNEPTTVTTNKPATNESTAKVTPHDSESAVSATQLPQTGDHQSGWPQLVGTLLLMGTTVMGWCLKKRRSLKN